MTPDEPTEAQRLPAGHHGIPAELVARNQRERLIAAMAEACAEEGYAEVAVADVVARARVSTATFYKHFASKQDCLLAAYSELFKRLLEEINVACAAASAGEEQVRSAIETCLELFAADPPTARLLTVEILAAGPVGSELYGKTVEDLARRLRGDRDAGDDQSVADAEWAVVASLMALAARRVMADEAESLPELGDELTRIALRLRH
ncbi:MAG: TetR/AcrR family transcriptional regulator [Solirubrobacterales bacterium]